MSPRKSTGSLVAATLWRLFGFLTASAVCGVLAASLVVPAVAATGVAVSDSIKFFNSLPSELIS